jgi:hypothetical protein
MISAEARRDRNAALRAGGLGPGLALFTVGSGAQCLTSPHARAEDTP